MVAHTRLPWLTRLVSIGALHMHCRVLAYPINLAQQISVALGVNCFRHRPVPLLPTSTALTSANPSP